MCFNVKPLKNICDFCTKIFDLVKNNIHNDKKNPRQEVLDMYACLNVKYLKKCL